MVRCCLCQRRQKNVFELRKHYLFTHGKSRIIRELIKTRLFLAIPRLVYEKTSKASKIERTPSKILYLSNELEVFVKRTAVIVRDTKNDTQYKFPMPNNQNNDTKRSKKAQPSRKRNKSKIKNPNPFKTFHIKIAPVQESNSINNNDNGDFYICNCRKVEREVKKSRGRKVNVKFVTSDTESCSEGEERAFCRICGNGYKILDELVLHLYSHFQVSTRPTTLVERVQVEQPPPVSNNRPYTCHICRAEFHFEHLDAHLQWHEEQRVLNEVLDMQEVYVQNWNRIPNVNNGDNLEDILRYLGEDFE